jgi:hypothetical protein
LSVLALSVRAAHNQVQAVNPNSWGVACIGCYDSVFEQNRIHYGGADFAGIALIGDPDWGEVSNVLVRGNRITGQGPFALVVAPPASYNTFVGNSINGFTPWVAHYIFFEGANHNVVAGQHGDVIDLGEGNRITGLTKKPGNIGQQISDGMQLRREKVKQIRW